MPLSLIRLKKGQERRIRSGHPWIFSNEVDTGATPLKSFTPGQEVLVQGQDQAIVGVAYVNPHSLITGRIFSREPNTRLDSTYFTQRITQALALREQLFSKPYYRLVFSEADELPGLVIDRFGHDLVVQINTAGMDHHQAIIVDALRAVLPETTSILLRNDSKMRLQEGLECYVKPAYGEPPETVTLIENDVQFSIPLLKGQKTGWFYDHRMNRARLKDYVKGRTVLDVFSYVGGWGVQAAAFGATHVDCIESSASACEFINKNAALNHVEDKVTTICDDAFDAMKALGQAKKKYDVIVLDPPAFVKRIKDLKEGVVAYQRINEMALKMLEPGGILVTCSCSMHVDMGMLESVMQRAAYKTQSKISIVERGHQGPDHPIHVAIPETDYLKAIFIRKGF